MLLEIETENDIRKYIDLRFKDMLIAIGAPLTENMLDELAYIFMKMLLMISRMQKKNLKSTEINSLSAKIINRFYDDIEHGGGDIVALVKPLKKQLCDETGAIDLDPLATLIDPSHFYKKYCKPNAIKRILAQYLFVFIFKYTGHYPRLRQARTVRIDGVYFDDFFNICEDVLKYLSVKSQNNIKYNQQRSDSTTNKFLKQEFVKFKKFNKGGSVMNEQKLTYEFLKEKAQREISRLIKSMEHMNEYDAKDHAINAAITVYSLFEWREKMTSQNPRSMTQICINTELPELQMLHHIVTYTKHAESTRVKPYKNTRESVNKVFDDLATEDGDTMADESEQIIYNQDSYLKVYFGDKEAIDVLKVCYKAALAG